MAWRAASGNRWVASMIGWATGTFVGLFMAALAAMAAVGSTLPQPSSTIEAVGLPAQKRLETDSQPSPSLPVDKGVLEDE